MADPPPTEEGWFVLHDFRRLDWSAWQSTPEREREAAIEAAVDYLESAAAETEGDTAIFTIAGTDADILLMHLRPTLDGVERAQRAFDRTRLGHATTGTNSFVSVTEIGGYTSEDYFAADESVSDGLKRYMQSKLYPSIPEDAYVSFYPMEKRRDPDANWYTTPMAERAEMMAEHGETGKGYAGTITQYITSGFGLDDWEWGVTLFSDDATALKRIVYEMRFDEATAKYGEFGPFYVGRRFPPEDLRAYLNGEHVPVDGDADDSAERGQGSDSGRHPGSEDGGHPGAESGGHPGSESGGHPGSEDRGHPGSGDGGHPGDATTGGDDDGSDHPVRESLSEEDVYAGQPHGEDVHAVALYSETDVEALAAEVDGLRSNFEHYDTHVSTAVYRSRSDGPNAVVSIWDTQSAAETASGFLADLPETVGRPGEVPEGWGTMGMFYTVQPEHREEFVETFDGVVDALQDFDGHRETDLLVNVADENDMFIASQWDSREDAMAFFESADFRETVDAGREMLADRPRHVFLA
jgi:chlorite dismutase/heme-degrading monooxygenase HmoA